MNRRILFVRWFQTYHENSVHLNIRRIYYCGQYVERRDSESPIKMFATEMANNKNEITRSKRNLIRIRKL